MHERFPLPYYFKEPKHLQTDSNFILYTCVTVKGRRIYSCTCNCIVWMNYLSKDFNNQGTIKPDLNKKIAHANISYVNCHS